MDEDKRDFKVGSLKLTVKRPTVDDIKEADRLRSQTFTEALEAGDLLRDQLDEVLRKRKLWSDDREARYQSLRAAVIDGEFMLAKGGLPLKEAKKIAVKMKDDRNEMISLLSSRTALDSNTCEGKADAVRFNYLFSKSLVYTDTGELFFPNGLDDYIEKQDDPVVIRSANEFFSLLSATEDVDSRLPENVFLKKFKFVNDNLELVDNEGRLVDKDGRHIDEYGNWIKWTSDTEFVKVDIEGRPLNEDGDFDVEHQPFLDDEGNPIDESAFEEKPKKRTRKKAASK